MSIVDEKRVRRASRPETPEAHAVRYHDAPEVVVTDGFGTSTPLPGTVGPELGAEDEVPPAYSEHHDQLSLHRAGFEAGAVLTEDGRVNINLNQTSRLLAHSLRDQLKEDAKIAAEAPLPPAYIPPSLGGQAGQTPPPRLNVVIQIVGSRGDVQPFVALGKVLRDTYGHRVRIATHPVFQQFVEENGLEFFSIGGDPAELMAFMVKNPGLMPGLDALKSGEVTKRRRGIEQIILGCWRSCIETGKGLGPAPNFSRFESDPSGAMDHDSYDPSNIPFVADAIIANPPSFAHIHVAEKLGVPLHLMFTMPWSPTKAFPQPLANIQSTNTDPATTNYISYALVEMMTWQGLGDIINRFRTKLLDLEPLPLLWAPAVITRLRVPYTYCWSPALIPKPVDWGQHIDVAGFFFLNLASSYTPDPELSAFLEAGPPPIYIGFGSIVVDDPNGLTRMIFDAVAETGVRALVSKGWGGLGADDVGIPEGVFMLGNVPHDWLFKHVSAVCHHGGAGTTAAGINAGKPTIVIPFFGDQPFWGAMVARAGAGPDPIPYRKLTVEGLAEAIRTAMKPETQARAKELGSRIREEKGTDVGAQCFHKHLDADRLRCSIVPSRTAVWRVRRTETRLSALAAATLVQLGYLQYSDLKLFRAKEYSTEDHPTDPISAVTSAFVGDITTIGLSIADFPRDIFKAARIRSKTQGAAENAADTASIPSNNAEALSTVAAQEDSTEAEQHAEAQRRTEAEAEAASKPRRLRLRPGNDVMGGLSLAFSSDTLPNPDDVVPARRKRATSNPETPRHGPTPPETATTSPQQHHDSLERAMVVGKSVNNIVSTGIRTPMNFCMGLAKGFRNLPKLYNDDTVRPPEKVKGLGSGLKIAGKEFGLGLYDGVSGLVTQPYRGAQKEGALGLVKGFGKGVGGFAFKPFAGLWSLPAYAMAGVDATIRSMFAKSAENYIIASRISQGNEDYKRSSQAERDDIEVRWHARKSEMKSFYAMKQRQKGKSRDHSPDSPLQHGVGESDEEPRMSVWQHAKKLSTEEPRSRLEEWRSRRRRQTEGATASISSHSGAHNEGLAPVPLADSMPEQDEEFEQAIRVAVNETSTGDPAEDARIERAIRASVAALRKRSATASSAATGTSNMSGGQVSSSVVDSKVQLPPALPPRTPYEVCDLEDITEEEYQELIEQAVQLSVMEHQRQLSRMQDGDSSDDEDFQRALLRSQTEPTISSNEEDDEEYRRVLEASQAEYANRERGGGLDDDDDEELRRAIEASQAEQYHNTDDDEELRRAIEASERAHKEQMARVDSLKSEEDIVLEYVKRQSLAEEQFRRFTKGKQKESSGSSSNQEDDEVMDEDLKKALEQSMQSDSKNGSSSSTPYPKWG
ncbi:hypothetical protein DL767_007870 [Monosporascus sp. MG133]|nr:hypothetical protein DL767_007870 [Monosporascus sp. MG133]